MVGEPSRSRRRSTSPSAGATSRATRAARERGDIPFNRFARAISAARVNLNVTRRRTPPFRLVDVAAVRARLAGAAIVSNPHEGIERWFEPGASS